MKFNYQTILLGILTLVVTASCVPRKKIAYFQEIENLNEYQINFNPVTIKPSDILSITVSAANMESVIPFNLLMISRPLVSRGEMLTQSNSQEIGYLVDIEGKINFPVLGELKVSGLDTKGLRDLLTEKISDYVKDPVVNVRIMNFTVSVLGEVARPGTYTVSGERISLPEALGLAGDMTIFGQRNNVLVIRENDGVKQYKYLDLSNADVLNSEFYYLQQHDIIYVEPNTAQRQSSSFNRNSSVYVSMASLLISVLVIIFR